MASTATGLFEINGVLDTSKTVWQNLDTLAAAARSYLTFDYNSYRWSVIINKPTSTVKVFTDRNIIGAINVTGSGLTEMYNRVQIDFPHKDMMDKRDSIILQIPDEDRFPNEPDNLLSLSFDIINDPVQASMIALTELKQSRLDKIIEFSTDYTAIGLKAGDVIEVTENMYNFQNKKFRVITIDESDIEDGSIILKITALEYDENVYNYDDIKRYERNNNTGITDASNNDTISNSDAAFGGVNVFSIDISTTELSSVYNQFTGAGVTWAEANGVPYQLQWASGVNPNDSESYLGTPGLAVGFYISNQQLTTMMVSVESPLGFFNYQFLDSTSDNVRTRSGLLGFIPTYYRMSYTPDTFENIKTIQVKTSDWQTQNVTFQLNNPKPGAYYIELRPLLTYDLNQRGTYHILPYGFQAQPNGNGAGVTINGYSFRK